MESLESVTEYGLLNVEMLFKVETNVACVPLTITVGFTVVKLAKQSTVTYGDGTFVRCLGNNDEISTAGRRIFKAATEL